MEPSHTCLTESIGSDFTDSQCGFGSSCSDDSADEMASESSGSGACSSAEDSEDMLGDILRKLPYKPTVLDLRVMGMLPLLSSFSSDPLQVYRFTLFWSPS